MNQVLEAWKLRPLDRVTELYARADRNFLTTFAETDHYPNRSGGEEGSERFTSERQRPNDEG